MYGSKVENLQHSKNENLAKVLGINTRVFVFIYLKEDQWYAVGL